MLAPALNLHDVLTEALAVAVDEAMEAGLMLEVVAVHVRRQCSYIYS